MNKNNINEESLAIKNRQKQNKELIIKQLKKTPIIQLVCEKLGIARSTYYRWKKADLEFSKDCDSALREGSLLINDMAESQLISAIREKNMTAIIFWLKHHHSAYATKVELSDSRTAKGNNLSEDQKKILNKALLMSGFHKSKT